MQEKNKTAVEPKSEESQVGQWDVLARNMVRLFDEGTKVLGTLAERRNGLRRHPAIHKLNAVGETGPGEASATHSGSK